ncbi:MAG: hypothetical protein ACKOU6_04645 [Planctomycetota bacterium]
MNDLLKIPNWHKWVGKLSSLVIVESKNFRVFGFPRMLNLDLDYDLMLSSGVHGIRDNGFVTEILDVLESTLQRCINEGWSVPSTKLKDKFLVFLYAVDDSVGPGSPIMDEIAIQFDKDSGSVVSTISLPTRSVHALQVDYENYCKVAAVHELSHLVKSATMPYRRIVDGIPRFGLDLEDWFESWLWFDEGLAVLAESEFLPELNNWLEYTYEWIDRPQFALDDPSMRYASVMFVRYLKRAMAQRERPRFVRDCWQKSGFVWEPELNLPKQTRLSALGAISESLNEQDVVFCDAQEQDLFASGYCFDALFLNVPGTLGYEPEVFERRGHRAICGALRLPSAGDAPGSFPRMERQPLSLPALSCCYISIRADLTLGAVAAEAEAVFEISVQVEDSQSAGKLKLEVVAVQQPEHTPVSGTRQVASRRIGTDGRERLTVQVPAPGTNCDYSAIITNCDWRPDEPNHPYDSSRCPLAKFRVEIRRL